MKQATLLIVILTVIFMIPLSGTYVAIWQSHYTEIDYTKYRSLIVKAQRDPIAKWEIKDAYEDGYISQVEYCTIVENYYNRYEEKSKINLQKEFLEAIK